MLAVCCEGHVLHGGAEGSPDPAVDELSCPDPAAELRPGGRTQQVVQGEAHQRTQRCREVQDVHEVWHDDQAGCER